MEDDHILRESTEILFSKPVAYEALQVKIHFIECLFDLGILAPKSQHVSNSPANQAFSYGQLIGQVNVSCYRYAWIDEP